MPITTALGTMMPLRNPDERPTNGRRVIAYSTATAQELLANAARAVQANESHSVWHVLVAELDIAMTRRQPGQGNEVRWAMLQLAQEELNGKQLPIPGMCPTCCK